jgi:hypothetical protein
MLNYKFDPLPKFPCSSATAPALLYYTPSMVLCVGMHTVLYIELVCVPTQSMGTRELVNRLFIGRNICQIRIILFVHIAVL